jgi:hypothetical protein
MIQSAGSRFTNQRGGGNRKVSRPILDWWAISANTAKMEIRHKLK